MTSNKLILDILEHIIWTKTNNLWAAHYFKTFKLDEWEVHLYMIILSLSLSILPQCLL